MKYTISIRGERDLWLDFIHRAKKERKKAWEVLSPYLRKYTGADEETRVLLLLFPRDLVDELLKQEDPDRFIQETIKEHLKRGR
jgi:hypothetical protein